MNIALVWFIIYLSLSTEALAHAVLYADEIPEEYVTEQRARRFPQRDPHLSSNSHSAIPEHKQDPGLTYGFHGGSSSSGNISPSEDSQSNPRYPRKQNLIDNVNEIHRLVPRESESDEDYNSFLLEPNQEHRILETAQKGEEETSNEGDKTGASDFAEPHSSEETEPESDYPCNNTVPADPDDKVVSEETGQESDHPCNTTIPLVQENFFDTTTIIVALGCIALAVVLVTVGVTIWYTCRKKTKAAADVKYPATTCKTIIFPKGSPRAVHSAQIYHYQHQKRKLMAVQSSSAPVTETESENGSDEELTILDRLK